MVDSFIFIQCKICIWERKSIF